ncbi:MAG: methylenetetrahydrofolate reductase [NAD(P)H] [Muribaculaceae bacterium]|nr:methylenetetrahydrofolate reductase [NAD(P)H] [Muribaculaceae bacterium]
MKVIDYIRQSTSPIFSFEILPPLKGNSIQKVYDIIDRLTEFDPKFINITSHHSESVFMPQPDGLHRKVSLRRRPGTVAVAAAIKYKYGIIPVPHIICTGFSKEETEYALLDLNFLGIDNLFIVRGDSKNIEPQWNDKTLYNRHATDLQQQINEFNCGCGLNGMHIDGIETKFSYGMACYPEKHEEAPNFESDIHYLKEKVRCGADYLITQMFFDNERYYSFVERCRREGIMVPIIPGIKPITKISQLTLLPKVFRTDIPEALACELRKAPDDNAARSIGIEWGIEQCRDLIAHGAPGIHFYTMHACESVNQIARAIY